MFEKSRALSQAAAQQYHDGQMSFILGDPQPRSDANEFFFCGWADEMMDYEETVYGVRPRITR